MKTNVFYMLENGVNKWFLKDGEVMIYRDFNGTVVNSVCTIQDVDSAFKRGVLKEVKPSDDLERMVLGFPPSDSKFDFGLLAIGAIVCGVALAFVMMM
jgi:hypothetical protein